MATNDPNFLTSPSTSITFSFPSLLFLHEFKEDVFDAGDDFCDGGACKAGGCKRGYQFFGFHACGKGDVDGVTEGLGAWGMEHVDDPPVGGRKSREAGGLGARGSEPGVL